jgi:hypothetical protein
MRRRHQRREQEQAHIELGGRPLAYLLKRSSARRTLALRVSEQGEVVVNAPWRLPVTHIEAFLHRHQDWLWQRLERPSTDPVWRNGMLLPVGGVGVCLDWQAELPAAPRRVGDRLMVGAAWEAVERQVLAWYRGEAHTLFPARLAHHAARMGVAAPPWRLSNARTRWGSLSPKGVVGLNWRLMKTPGEILDYVICHELAHLRQRNHSPAFWREVGKLYPDYLEAREHLRRLGRHYLEF